jgi:hypothetical protein
VGQRSIIEVAGLSLVDVAADPFEVALLVLAGAATAAPVGVVKLHDARAALDETAREQAIARE